MSGLLNRLLETPIPVLTDESLAGYTGLKVGGPADILARPRTAKEVALALNLAEQAGAQVFILGRGTNLLIGDGGLRGLVILIGTGFEGDSVVIHESRCIAAAGIELLDLLVQLCQAGLSGLEDLFGIPGSLGGALAMNAGAYGVEIWTRVGWIEVALPSTEIQRYPRSEIEYGYRRATLPRGSAIIRVELVLDRGDSSQIRKRCLERRADREKKHPLEWPNCGSVFENFPWEPGMDIEYENLETALGNDFSRRSLEDRGPCLFPAWRLVDACGLTGRRIGGARISTKHSNFMINLGGAKAAEFAALIELVQKTVKGTFGIRLETEVRRLGEWNEELKPLA